MKRLSTGIFAAFLLLALTGAGFTPKPSNTTSPTHLTAAPRQTLYYFFSWPYDVYNDRKILSDEIYEMWIWYGGVLIDTNPGGGTLIERGYADRAQPHDMLPVIFLYAHFD
jgi:hypothetical protein